jgi:hypothetical protein
MYRFSEVCGPYCQDGQEALERGRDGSVWPVSLDVGGRCRGGQDLVRPAGTRAPSLATGQA